MIMQSFVLPIPYLCGDTRQTFVTADYRDMEIETPWRRRAARAGKSLTEELQPFDH